MGPTYSNLDPDLSPPQGPEYSKPRPYVVGWAKRLVFRVN